MTPKEKAKELFYRFYVIEPVQPIYIGMDKAQAKQCALICVDEILKFHDRIDVYYWNEVKQDIKKTW
tara:strand:- start:929 stop:1129 length:201 start_codon:yes stop_codon:yes gene_type:complete